MLVGHSGGGALARAAADARPDRVARVVYVDSMPLGDGRCSSAQLRGWIGVQLDRGHLCVAELAVMRDVDYIDLPTGHWPQFTKPAQLGLAAVDRR